MTTNKNLSSPAFSPSDNLTLGSVQTVLQFSVNGYLKIYTFYLDIGLAKTSIFHEIRLFDPKYVL